jgi:hypothetical protein
MTNKYLKYSLIFTVLIFLFSCNNSDIITKSEKEWLKQHPNLSVGISPNQPPYQFIDKNGLISGMFIDYLTIIEDRLDYKFKKVYQADWTKLLLDAKEGNVDVVLQIQKTEDRNEFLNFTPVLISHKHVIVVKNAQEYITSINDLKGKKIAVGNSYAVQEYLSKTYPDYSIIPYFDNITGLRAVSTGQADAFITQQAVATYYLGTEGISNLKIVGEIKYSNKLAIASRKNLDTLYTILAKAVNSITKTEKQNIDNNWLSYEVKPFYLKAKFWIIIVVIFLIVISFIGLINFVLQKRVKQKTKELKIAKEKAEENEFIIQKQYQEQKLLDEETKRVALLLQSSIESPKDMIILSIDKNYNYLYFNKSHKASMVYAYGKDVKIGMNILECITSDEDRKNARTNYDKALAGESHITIQEFGEIDKSYYETRYNTIFNDQSEIIGATAFSANITERKQTELLLQEKNNEIAAQNIEYKHLNEELIIAKEKAEESDKLKSAFLANMSHEIRTPMNGILGFSELLKEPGLTGEQQQEYIRIIEKSGVRMLNIINDIVDISKIESGLMMVNNQGTNINDKIEFIYIFFKPLVEEKGIQFFFKNTLPTKEAIIRTDSEKFYSILTNLVKNAIKYSKEGAIEFGYIKKDKTLEFYVKDTGIGIPKDRQSVIFERFIQADISDKMAQQGAGLGLSISKAYVGMLGGKIWVESEEGIGSTFYFTLPYTAEPEENKFVKTVVSAQNEKNHIKDLKILITEDDETSEMLITIDVDKFSKEILIARNGFEAIEVCRNNPDTDLILMDVQMPVMNGHEATRQIRQFNKDVVIIAQTAFGLSGDREKAIEAGCNDYIAKPINKDELLLLIQKYFKK